MHWRISGPNGRDSQQKFTSLQKKGLISVKNREIELLNIQSLRDIISST
ncbi:MAG: hypothetical protein P8N94_01405 [Gammaproteobacteria bacterium]|nr:hypothetical protein [Gammaproteobacteria bacterium]